MKTLFITDRFVAGKTSGWSLRKHSLLEIFARLGKVDIVLTQFPASSKHDLESLNGFLQDKCQHVYFHPLTDSSLGLTRFFQALKSPYRMSVLQYRSEIADLVRGACAHSPDLVFFDTLFVAPYINAVPESVLPKCVLSPHNVESELEWQFFQHFGIHGKPRSFLRYLDIMKLERRELHKFACIAAVSERDANFYRFLCPTTTVAVVPNAIEVDSYPFNNDERQKESLLFVGSLHYKPNLDGLLWFIKSVLPAVKERFPRIILRVVGHGSKNILHDLRVTPGVEFLGHVKDVRKYFQESGIFVCPLLSGSGTRFKIIEALASGIPVVSTSKGCEGLNVEDERQLLIADKAKAFSEKLMRLIQYPQLCRTMSSTARVYVEQHLSYTSLSQSLREIVHSLIQGYSH